MRVTLVHNPVAGDADHNGTVLTGHLRAAGHDPTYSSTEAERLSHALKEPADVILIAGGDGTVAAVTRLVAASERNVPIAFLPMGTANNIARSVGASDDIERLIHGLDAMQTRRLDVPTIHAAWGTSRFVESAGVGAFAATLRDEPRVDDTPPRRGGRLRRSLAASQASDWRVEADGVDLSGSYLMVMVLNTANVGPGLALAPDADPGDGELDLVLIEEHHRPVLAGYLDALGRGEEPVLGIDTRRATRVRLEWSASLGHVDDRPWPETPDATAGDHLGIVEIAIEGRPLQVLTPSD